MSSRWSLLAQSSSPCSSWVSHSWCWLAVQANSTVSSVVELGAGERAVTLSCLVYRQSRSQLFAEVVADSFGLGVQTFL